MIYVRGGIEAMRYMTKEQGILVFAVCLVPPGLLGCPMFLLQRCKYVKRISP